MNRNKLIIIVALTSVFFGGFIAKTNVEIHNQLTQTEIDEGWVLLFDGQTFNGWRSLGIDHVQEGIWKIEDEAIRKINSHNVTAQATGRTVESSDLISIDTYENFELSFEWKLNKDGNSGIKYNVSEEISMQYPPTFSALGFEYQMLDNDCENYKKTYKPSYFAGSLYDMIIAQNVHLKPIGEFNKSRIILNGNHGEHWLNGVMILEYEMGTSMFNSLYQASKYKKYPDFEQKRKGHIVITNHVDDSWHRNIKIRKL